MYTLKKVKAYEYRILMDRTTVAYIYRGTHAIWYMLDATLDNVLGTDFASRQDAFEYYLDRYRG